MPSNMPTNINDNIIQPFSLETSNLRGRVVRFGTVMDEILKPHAYPGILEHLMGEALVMTALLSSMLKYEGIFTLQTKGDGPVPMMICDMRTDGSIRGCASYDPDRLKAVHKQLSAFSKEVDEGSINQLAQLLGQGYIAFTVDQGQHAERYQGIVELKGASLTDCVQHYFTQSEQIKTGIKMAIGQREGQWRAAGIMLQTLPEEETRQAMGNIDEDAWRRSMILMDSVTDDELLSPEISANDLLIRLFHEEGVRVYEPLPLTRFCKCTNDSVESVLMLLSEEDLRDTVKDGKIKMTCEFCNYDFVFDPKDIARKIKEAKKK